jgi:hypothetical protein
VCIGGGVFVGPGVSLSLLILYIYIYISHGDVSPWASTDAFCPISPAQSFVSLGGAQWSLAWARAPKPDHLHCRANADTTTIIYNTTIRSSSIAPGQWNSFKFRLPAQSRRRLSAYSDSRSAAPGLWTSPMARHRVRSQHGKLTRTAG